MAKQKKKRSKKYSGIDASKRPSVTKITAANRSKTSQWLFDRKLLLKPAGIVLVIILITVLILSGIFRLF